MPSENVSLAECFNASKESGNDEDEDEVKEIMGKEDVSKYFHRIMAGDNATIVFGSNNMTSVRNIVKNGDWESLAFAFRSNGVSNDDIVALKEAVERDEGAPELQTQQLGPSVRNWMKRMCEKAVDASWQIEVGVARGC